MTSLLRVQLGNAALGLHANAVQEIVRAVAITPLPGAPRVVEGVINVRGQIVPVLDVRLRLALPGRDLHPDEFFVLLGLAGRVVAVRVDEVDDLIDVDAEAVEGAAAVSPALQGLAGLAARSDGVLVIYDPEAFLGQAEAEALDAALAAPLAAALGAPLGATVEAAVASRG
ncbi:MAG: chemotaxis protein CheW [Gemmatimonadaceae bacterium]|nr:chemotaxis protein CheW [Gemmatimonadaceae bacterium]